MRIRFLNRDANIDEKGVESPAIYSEEYYISGINPSPKNTVCAGRYVARRGVLCGDVEDITEYRTEIDEDGNKIQVEVIPGADIG
jgi:hypothetical protein